MISSMVESSTSNVVNNSPLLFKAFAGGNTINSSNIPVSSSGKSDQVSFRSPKSVGSSATKKSRPTKSGSRRNSRASTGGPSSVKSMPPPSPHSLPPPSPMNTSIGAPPQSPMSSVGGTYPGSVSSLPPQSPQNVVGLSPNPMPPPSPQMTSGNISGKQPMSPYLSGSFMPPSPQVPGGSSGGNRIAMSPRVSSSFHASPNSPQVNSTNFGTVSHGKQIPASSPKETSNSSSLPPDLTELELFSPADSSTMDLFDPQNGHLLDDIVGSNDTNTSTISSSHNNSVSNSKAATQSTQDTRSATSADSHIIRLLQEDTSASTKDTSAEQLAEKEALHSQQQHQRLKQLYSLKEQEGQIKTEQAEHLQKMVKIQQALMQLKTRKEQLNRYKYTWFCLTKKKFFKVFFFSFLLFMIPCCNNFFVHLFMIMFASFSSPTGTRPSIALLLCNLCEELLLGY